MQITIRNNRPALLEGCPYRIDDGSEPAVEGSYLIHLELSHTSKVRLDEQYLRIDDMSTVGVLRMTQVAS